MGNPMAEFKMEHWWHAFTVTGAGGMIASLAVKFDFIPQRDAFCLFLGMFLFGIGQWINHPVQANIHFDPRATFTSTGHPRHCTFFGVCLELLGGLIFVVEVFRIMFHK
jgi:hypothetical protein